MRITALQKKIEIKSVTHLNLRVFFLENSRSQEHMCPSVLFTLQIRDFFAAVDSGAQEQCAIEFHHLCRQTSGRAHLKLHSGGQTLWRKLVTACLLRVVVWPQNDCLIISIVTNGTITGGKLYYDLAGMLKFKQQKHYFLLPTLDPRSLFLQKWLIEKKLVPCRE